MSTYYLHAKLRVKRGEANRLDKQIRAYNRITSILVKHAEDQLNSFVRETVLTDLTWKMKKEALRAAGISLEKFSEYAEHCRKTAFNGCLGKGVSDVIGSRVFANAMFSLRKWNGDGEITITTLKDLEDSMFFNAEGDVVFHEGGIVDIFGKKYRFRLRRSCAENANDLFERKISRCWINRHQVEGQTRYYLSIELSDNLGKPISWYWKETFER